MKPKIVAKTPPNTSPEISKFLVAALVDVLLLFPPVAPPCPAV